MISCFSFMISSGLVSDKAYLILAKYLVYRVLESPIKRILDGPKINHPSHPVLS